MAWSLGQRGQRQGSGFKGAGFKGFVWGMRAWGLQSLKSAVGFQDVEFVVLRGSGVLE